MLLTVSKETQLNSLLKLQRDYLHSKRVGNADSVAVRYMQLPVFTLNFIKNFLPMSLGAPSLSAGPIFFLLHEVLCCAHLIFSSLSSNSCSSFSFKLVSTS